MDKLSASRRTNKTQNVANVLAAQRHEPQWRSMAGNLHVRNLDDVFGAGAGVWIRMQAAYDTWEAERKEDVSKIPTPRIKAA
jgi:plasmid maintenance system antidote protein VapI